MSLKEKTRAIGIHYKDGAHKNLIVKGQGPFTLHFLLTAARRLRAPRSLITKTLLKEGYSMAPLAAA